MSERVVTGCSAALGAMRAIEQAGWPMAPGYGHSQSQLLQSLTRALIVMIAVACSRGGGRASRETARSASFSGAGARRPLIERRG